MAKLIVVHRNLETHEFDIGTNDKVSWIILKKDNGKSVRFTSSGVEQ